LISNIRSFACWTCFYGEQNNRYHCDDVENAINGLLERYLLPHHRLQNYHTFRLVLAMREKYLTLHRAVVSRLQQQRERYSHVGGGSLIVCQLHHWHEQWCVNISKLLGLVLFTFALYPYWLDCEYREIRKNAVSNMMFPHSDESETSDTVSEIGDESRDLMTRRSARANLRRCISIVRTTLTTIPIFSNVSLKVTVTAVNQCVIESHSDGSQSDTF
jgi:hypothetical protein